MKNFRPKKFLGVFIFLAVFAACIAIVMLLWNALIPSIIGWTTINYWQAAGLMVLSRLLLGGFGRFGKFGRHSHRKQDKDFRYWHALRDKMKDMPLSERREYIRQHMKDSKDFKDNFFDRRNSRPDFGTAEDNDTNK
ncbi:hypothetical protein D0T84_08185 [Dysgonomonas sp. 521]|uniref:hypothetical protein n=1 Tax=Dysgonomonas sp. 521 TaxID=2302932 RepID=UPI0013D5A3DB|nr:hypothetical protein [Dysgonomonas sp. 521]NDV94894.1 hypothetical protein [Dysgonomonas sp. 521]